MKKKALYICIEGSEGTGKGTQVALLNDLYTSKNKKVFLTKEPGTDHSKLTTDLRAIAINAAYDDHMTITGREYILQAIRSVHIEKVVNPALETHDLIIQDRGMLSGITYGVACGVSFADMITMATLTNEKKPIRELYDLIILFKGDIKKGLDRASNAKQEFEAGDSMEKKGINFFNDIDQKFDQFSHLFKKVVVIEVDGKTREAILAELEAIIDPLL